MSNVSVFIYSVRGYRRKACICIRSALLPSRWNRSSRQITFCHTNCTKSFPRGRLRPRPSLGRSLSKRRDRRTRAMIFPKRWTRRNAFAAFKWKWISLGRSLFFFFFYAPEAPCQQLVTRRRDIKIELSLCGGLPIDSHSFGSHARGMRSSVKKKEEKKNKRCEI